MAQAGLLRAMRRAVAVTLWCLAVPAAAGAVSATIGWVALSQFDASVDALDIPRIGLCFASATVLSARAGWQPRQPLSLRITLGCLGFLWGFVRPVMVEMAVLGYLGYGTCGEQDFPAAYVLEAILNPLFPFFVFG